MERSKYAQRDLPLDWLLSDDLRMLKAEFAKHSGGDLLINSSGLDVVLKRLSRAVAMAKKYENIISRKEWNARAELDRQARHNDEALLSALADPSRKVVLFGATDEIEVPFSDGRE